MQSSSVPSAVSNSSSAVSNSTPSVSNFVPISNSQPPQEEQFDESPEQETFDEQEQENFDDSQEPDSPDQSSSPANRSAKKPITFADFQRTLTDPEDIPFEVKLYMTNQILAFCYLRGYFYDLNRHNDYISEISKIVKEDVARGKPYDFREFNFDMLHYITTTKRFGEDKPMYTFPPNSHYQKPNFRHHQKFNARNPPANNQNNNHSPDSVPMQNSQVQVQSSPDSVPMQNSQAPRNSFVPRGRGGNSRGRGSHTQNGGYQNNYQNNRGSYHRGRGRGGYQNAYSHQYNNNDTSFESS